MQPKYIVTTAHRLKKCRKAKCKQTCIFKLSCSNLYSSAKLQFDPVCPTAILDTGYVITLLANNNIIASGVISLI